MKVTLFVVSQQLHQRRGMKLGEAGRWASMTADDAITCWNRAYACNAETTASEADIEAVEVALPEWAIWQGDTISVELHRGGSENEDGIHSGGGWRAAVGYADVSMIWLLPDNTVGSIEGDMMELGTDRHVQSMSLKVGAQGFPYRNAAILRRRDPVMESGAV